MADSRMYEDKGRRKRGDSHRQLSAASRSGPH
jgi:hypothetical protein